MFQLLLFSLFFGLSWGLEQGCIEKQFINKSRDAYPKPGAYCTSPEAENRWRGELIYEYLEGLSGIKVNWKHIVQRSDCDTVSLKFFVNNRFVKGVSHYVHKNIDWVEIRAEKTFELKIQAQYHTEPYHEEPKCLEASTTITLTQTISPTYSDEKSNSKPLLSTIPPLQILSTLEVDVKETTQNNRITQDSTTTQNNTTTSNENTTTKNNTTTTQENTTPKNNMTTLNSTATEVPINQAVSDVQDGGENTDPDTTTIVICSAVGSGVLLITIAGITLCRRKSRSSSNNLRAEVDENPDYGIYSDDPDDDYITVEDNNPYYGT